jgi:hypothetical protein
MAVFWGEMASSSPFVSKILKITQISKKEKFNCKLTSY